MRWMNGRTKRQCDGTLGEHREKVTKQGQSAALLVQASSQEAGLWKQQAIEVGAALERKAAEAAEAAAAMAAARADAAVRLERFNSV